MGAGAGVALGVAASSSSSVSSLYGGGAMFERMAASLFVVGRPDIPLRARSGLSTVGPSLVQQSSAQQMGPWTEDASAASQEQGRLRRVQSCSTGARRRERIARWIEMASPGRGMPRPKRAAAA